MKPEEEPTVSRPRASNGQEDEELVLKAREGDGEAFGVLIERHQKSVAGFLLTLLHDMDAAEDAAQQAFLQAFQHLGRFESRASFKTWVSRIALNVAKSRLRWAGLRRWLPLGADDGDRGWEERLRPIANGPDEIKAVERKLELERAMAKLSAREKQVAALRLEGYSLGEAAEVLGISEGTVKSTLFEAVQKMRRQLS